MNIMHELTAESNDISIKPLQLILVIAVLQCITAFFTVPMIFTFDESMWHYIGRNWIRNGLVPYGGGVDNKSPLIFLIFGISDWLFGVNYWFPRLLGMAVQSAGIYGLFKIAERTISPRAGIFAIYFCMVQNKNQFAFIGGLFAGLGCGFRLSAIFGILPVFIFTFKKNPKSAFLFLLGIVTSASFLVILAGFAGIKMNELLFYGITDNFGAGSATAHSLAWKVQQFADGYFYSELLLFYPAVVLYFFLVRKLNFLKVWLISEFLGIMIVGIYDRVHFKDLLPAMSLMSAFVINYWVENDRAPAKQILLGLWIVFFPKTFEPLFAFKRFFYSKNNLTKSDSQTPVFEDENMKKQIGLWIRSNTVAS